MIQFQILGLNQVPSYLIHTHFGEQKKRKKTKNKHLIAADQGALVPEGAQRSKSVGLGIRWETSRKTKEISGIYCFSRPSEVVSIVLPFHLIYFNYYTQLQWPSYVTIRPLVSQVRLKKLGKIHHQLLLFWRMPHRQPTSDKRNVLTLI